MAAAFATVLGSSISGAIGCYFAFEGFRLALPFAGALVIMSSQTIGASVGITPGGLGFQEVLGLYFASRLTVTTAQTLMVLASMRVVKTGVAILFGVPSTMALSRNLHVNRLPEGN